MKLSSVTVFSNGHELSRLLNAALVSPKFRKLLLHDPQQALRSGYRGEHFALNSEDRALVLTIRADSLVDFARQLMQRRERLPAGTTIRVTTELSQE